jgi:hypothetical protein
MVIVMMPGAKRTSTSRRASRILPSAERRLRASFPEVWAWYELLVSARDLGPLGPTREERERPAQRSSARR